MDFPDWKTCNAVTIQGISPKIHFLGFSW